MRKISLLVLLWTMGILSVKAQSISKAEYFFDADPGPGKGIALSVTASGAISATYSVPVGALSAGMHKIFVRFGYSTGEWGAVEGDLFYVDPNPIDTSVKVESIEYFFDRDPGAGKALALSATPSTSVTVNGSVPVSTLANGWHKVYTRGKYSNGQYGFFTGETFFIQKTPGPDPMADIVKVEYYFDKQDTQIEHAVNMPFSPVRVDSVLVSASPKIDSPIHDTIHFISVRVKNAYGSWTKDSTRMFKVPDADGIEKLTQGSNPVFIYPNPFSDYLTLEGDMKNILLTDVTGKEIMNIASSPGYQKHRLDMSTLKPGIYIVKIFSGNAVQSSKVFKQ